MIKIVSDILQIFLGLSGGLLGLAPTSNPKLDLVWGRALIPARGGQATQIELSLPPTFYRKVEGGTIPHIDFVSGR